MHLYVLWLGAHKHRCLRRPEASDLPGTGLRSGSELPERLLGAQLQDTVCFPLPIPLAGQYPGSLSPTKVGVSSERPAEKLFLFCFPKGRGDKEGLYDLREGQGHHRINLGQVGSLKGPQFIAAELSTKKGQPGLKDLVTAGHPSRPLPSPIPLQNSRVTKYNHSFCNVAFD